MLSLQHICLLFNDYAQNNHHTFAYFSLISCTNSNKAHIDVLYPPTMHIQIHTLPSL